MRRGMFWGILLLVIGTLILLENLGALDFLGVSILQIIGPLALVALGVWILVGTRLNPSLETTELSLPTEGATKAQIRIDYGAGELRIVGGAETGSLVSGTFEGGVKHEVRRTGDLAEVRLWSPSPSAYVWGWGPSTRRRWQLRLTDAVPLDLTVKCGASDTRLDLEELRVSRLRLESGASSTTVTLPARAGYTEVKGSAGAASVSMRIPEGVAARIQTGGALSSTAVDRQRFPRQGGVYISPDYETAENKVDIRIDVGVGSVDIH